MNLFNEFKKSGFWFTVVVLFCGIYFSCSPANKESVEGTSDIKSDTTEIIRNFVFGLWSLDSDNSLSNEGFYFRPDGTVDFVAAESTGNWVLPSNDSLEINYADINQVFKVLYKIDSISEGRMVLSDSDGTYLFRKVPFGMNNEGTVSKGFSGSLAKGNRKEYMVTIPGTKKVELRLSSENTEIAFQVFNGNTSMTPTAVRKWTAIMVRGGEYKVVIEFPKTAKAISAAEYDLKVLEY